MVFILDQCRFAKADSHSSSETFLAATLGNRVPHQEPDESTSRRRRAWRRERARRQWRRWSVAPIAPSTRPLSARVGDQTYRSRRRDTNASRRREPSDDTTINAAGPSTWTTRGGREDQSSATCPSTRRTHRRPPAADAQETRACHLRLSKYALWPLVLTGPRPQRTLGNARLSAHAHPRPHARRSQHHLFLVFSTYINRPRRHINSPAYR